MSEAPVPPRLWERWHRRLDLHYSTRTEGNLPVALRLPGGDTMPGRKRVCGLYDGAT